MYKLKKGIPREPKRWKSKYPFDKMEIGDMFELLGIKTSSKAALYSASTRYRKEVNPEFKIEIRIHSNCIKVWRIK